MDALLKIAVQEIGVKEIAGPDDHNPTIVNYAKEAGFSWVNDDETPWCSIFLNWCASKAELPLSKNAGARSWLLIGEKIAEPLPGDVVVFWRESLESWKGHVGIFLGFDETTLRVYCLGGNQGNMVSITAYNKTQVLGYRRLYPTNVTQLPTKVLRIGDVNDEVKMLQQALTKAGFECGLADGFFGPKTEAAVKKFQSIYQDLPITGVFNKKTRSYLEEALKA